MFTINALQLIGIIAGAAFVGSMLGFFTACFMAAAGRNDEEEERCWPGRIER